jgi:hypothetical protein
MMRERIQATHPACFEGSRNDDQCGEANVCYLGQCAETNTKRQRDDCPLRKSNRAAKESSDDKNQTSFGP